MLPNNLDYAVNGGGVTLWRNVSPPTAARLRGGDRRRPASATTPAGRSTSATAISTTTATRTSTSPATTAPTGCSSTRAATGTFRDVTEEALGFDTRKGMNVDMGDYDRDGWLDIYVTNITDEYMKECNMLWHNNG